MLSAVAVLTALVGLLALRKSWSLPTRSFLLIVGGWALILISLTLWAQIGGHDRGVALGLIAFSLLALLVVGYNAFADKPTGRSRKAPVRRVSLEHEKASFLIYVRRFGIGALVVVGAGSIAFLAALGVHELMLFTGVHASSSLVTGLFLFPILWASFSGFLLISKRVWLKAGVVSTVTALGAGLLVIGN